MCPSQIKIKFVIDIMLEYLYDVTLSVKINNGWALVWDIYLKMSYVVRTQKKWDFPNLNFGPQTLWVAWVPSFKTFFFAFPQLLRTNYFSFYIAKIFHKNTENYWIIFSNMSYGHLKYVVRTALKFVMKNIIRNIKNHIALPLCVILIDKKQIDRGK